MVRLDSTELVAGRRIYFWSTAALFEVFMHCYLIHRKDAEDAEGMYFLLSVERPESKNQHSFGI